MANWMRCGRLNSSGILSTARSARRRWKASTLCARSFSKATYTSVPRLICAKKFVEQIAQRNQQSPRQSGVSRGRDGCFCRRSVLWPAAAALITIMLFVIPSHKQSTLTAELIDAHVRSLQPGHLFDVQSTDQHTVKPWFDGKLDFIPPVTDYAAQGFPLVGGRLDVVDGHNVAALVYARRKHFINVFVWPKREKEPIADRSGSRQGYNWVAGQSGDMQIYLVSDAALSDLRELKTLIHP